MMSERPMMRLVALLLLGVLVLAAPLGRPAAARSMEKDFRNWLEGEFRPRALKHGIPRRLFDAALGHARPNLKLPDLALPGRPYVPRAQRQTEFAAPRRYFSERSLRILSRRGRGLMARHRRLLERITRRYGVPGEIVIAIWGRESNFGAARIPHDAFAILATQAWAGRRREKFARELLAALAIVARGHASLKDMKSSWAGALGQPQMMPTAYLEYAVDFDGDGRRDIWRSVPDILASIANHLRKSGWRRDRGWGYEVTVPASVSCALEGPDQGRAMARWAKMGIRRVKGRRFPPRELKRTGFLLMPAGRFGPAFLVTENFYVLKEYNMSDLYALFVGHLGDRIRRGDHGFSRPWGDVGHMWRSEVARMQRKLEKLGHDVGGADGLPGYKTRRSIGRWQRAKGMRQTCFPTRKLKELLR